METDPYAPPASASDPQPAAVTVLREIVLAWEKLRLIYNALLAVPGLLVLAVWLGEYRMPPVPALVSCGLVAGGANLCFFLGPAAELYLRGLFRGSQPLGRGRWLIFGAGTLLSLGGFLAILFELRSGLP